MTLLAASLGRSHARWDEQASPAGNVSRAVAFLDRLEGWAVGDTGAVLRFSYGTWSNFPSGTDQDLYDVAVLSSSDAWAVGENGTILHYAPSCPTCADEKWTPHPRSGLATLLPLNAVAFVNSQNGFAVGGDEARGGVVLKFVGGTWVSATLTSEPLYDLFPLASDDVWFCGGNRALLRFDGDDFLDRRRGAPAPYTPVSDGGAWWALAFPFRSTGWVVGDGGTIARYSDAAGAWSVDVQGSSLTGESLRGASFRSETGRGYVVGTNGVRLHYEGPGSAGFALEAAGCDAHFEDVDLINELEGGAVGSRPVSPAALVRASNALGSAEAISSAAASPSAPSPTAVSVSVTSAPACLTLGAAYTVSIDVRNEGTQPLTSLLVVDTLPAELSVTAVSDGASLATSTAPGGGTLMVWTLAAALAPGAVRSVTVSGTVMRVPVGGAGEPRLFSVRALTSGSAAIPVDRARVFPNPYNSLGGRALTFDRLPDDLDELEIFSVLGDRVARLGNGIVYDRAVGVATWSGFADDGSPAAAGAYVYRIKAGGRERTGVFLVNRR